MRFGCIRGGIVVCCLFLLCSCLLRFCGVLLKRRDCYDVVGLFCYCFAVGFARGRVFVLMVVFYRLRCNVVAYFSHRKRKLG